MYRSGIIFLSTLSLRERPLDRAVSRSSSVQNFNPRSNPCGERHKNECGPRHRGILAISIHALLAGGATTSPANSGLEFPGNQKNFYPRTPLRRATTTGQAAAPQPANFLSTLSLLEPTKFPRFAFQQIKIFLSTALSVCGEATRCLFLGHKMISNFYHHALLADERLARSAMQVIDNCRIILSTALLAEERTAVWTH